jgi:glycosyltransferase involved in cell wall biosynthesis
LTCQASDDPLDIAVMLDSPDENWPSMDLVGEMLLAQWCSTPSQVKASGICLPIPRMARRLIGATRHALNVDRALTRYLAYPLRAAVARRPDRLFHVVDHSYAQLLHVLPTARTGVYCHDLDAFEAILRPQAQPPNSRVGLSKALAWALFRGLKSAAVVFHSTREVGRALQRHGLAPSRLVHAPYGVASEFNALHDPRDGADGVLSRLGPRPFVLHVGSSERRKRLEVLFEVFARLRAKRPELGLVQQGAVLSTAQRAHLEKLGIESALIQPPKLERSALAGLYRRAAVVLVTSDAEGFGFPVLEALACGAIVVASDIPAMREVGGEAALYAPVGDVPIWTRIVDAVLAGDIVPPRDLRIERARGFTWERHARTILEAYRNIADTSRPGAQTPWGAPIGTPNGAS